MKRHTYLLAGLVLASLSSLAHAQTAPAWNENRMSWEPPTTCSVASEPLSRCPTASYTIEHSRGTLGPWPMLASVPASQLTYTHIAPAGENCYRIRAVNATAGAGPPSALLLCRTNVEPPPPPPPQIPPGPPTNPRFVTVAATAHSLHNVTPVVTILSGNRPGTYVGQVALGRVTKSGPIFNLHDRPHCRVEVAPKEMFKRNAKPADLLNLAAACGPSA